MIPHVILAVFLALVVAPPGRASNPTPMRGAVWPTPEMQRLPADYLERLRHSLQIQADEFGSSDFQKADVIKVRTGIAGLALGQHMDELNACLGAEGFGWKPKEDMGFSLFSAAYVRLYALFNDRSGVMKGRLSPAAQTNLEKSFWDCAKVYSKITDASRDVWLSEGSENHHVTSKISDFLVAQFLKDIPAYAGLKYDDGSTPLEQYEAGLKYWNKWLDQRARRGLFYEDGSSYENYTIEALLNLRDFAADPVLRRKADMFLDLAFANFAEETLGPVRGGPKTRTKEEGFESVYYGLLFDQGERYRKLGNYYFPTSSFYPSPAVVALARDAVRGRYSWSKRCPGFFVSKEADWLSLDPERSIIRNGFSTPHFHMGSHGFDASAEVDWQARQQRWQGVIFANDPMARISMDGKSDRDIHSGYISNPFKTIQDRNVMVTMKWGPVADEKIDPNLWIYFSSALDLVEEEQGWIFVKSGDAFAAVHVAGGHEWLAPWEHGGHQKCFARLLRPDSPVITIASDAADYAADFQVFKKAVLAQPVDWIGGVLKFATITHEGPLKPGSIAGKPVDLRPSRLNDSPFIRSDWDTGVVCVRKGNQILKLDFSDPGNPRRTLGGSAAGGFPPGSGTSTPIVFDSKGGMR